MNIDFWYLLLGFSFGQFILFIVSLLQFIMDQSGSNRMNNILDILGTHEN